MIRTLFISTVIPESGFVTWEFIDSLAGIFGKFSDVFFWFSACNKQSFETSLDYRFVTESIRVPKWKVRLRAFFSNTYIASGYITVLENSLKKVLEDFKPDVIVFCSLSSAAYLTALKNLGMSAKLILLEHNVEYLVVRDLVRYGSSLLQRFYYLPQLESVRKFEERVLKSVDYVISVSGDDRSNFSKLYGLNPEKVFVIRPLITYEKCLYRANSSQEKNISFFATFNWYPNVHGSEFLIQKVLPLLLKSGLQVRIRLVGRNPTSSVLRLAKRYPRHVEVTGSVRSVEEYYKTSSIVVAPVFLGPGIKVKVLQAMASGVPTVMTSYVAKDYDLLNKGFLIADTPEEFVDAIKRVLEDQDFANEISRKQVEWYENYLERETAHALEVIKKILKE